MTPQADIVIVNWNAGAQLDGCLSSIAAHGAGRVGQIVVVDNGSTDGSEASARRTGVTLLTPARNLGFAAACNLGAAGLTSPYLLLLNPDAQLLPGTLPAMLAVLEADPGAAVCGVRLLGDDGRVQRHVARAPTPGGFLAEATGLARFAPRLSPGLLDPGFDHDRTAAAAHVIGAVYLVRRSVWDALGGFDQRFFLYLEDLDFSTRARAAGHHILYLASASARHRGGGTSAQARAWRLQHALTSRTRFARKHFSPASAAAVTVATLTLEPLARIAGALLHRSGPELRQTLGAYRALYAHAWARLGERARRR